MKKILVIYTGGTIGMARQGSDGALVPVEFEKLYALIPELKELPAEIHFQSWETPIDSTEMTPDHWVKLAHQIFENYAFYDGFVVLHGSDTMAFTASALSFMLCHLNKPVILTGSQLPINIIRTDGKENLLTSIEIAMFSDENGEPLVREVCIYFEYKLYRGNRTYKHSSESFKAYKSPNYPLLGEAGLEIKIYRQNLLPSSDAPVHLFTDYESNILNISLFPGINFQWMRSALENAHHLKALILLTYGAGNAPKNPELKSLLKMMNDRKIPVINISQCKAGSVAMGKYEVSHWLLDHDVISGYDMTREAAITKTMCTLPLAKDLTEFKRLFQTPLAGEITLN
ncbi:MAG: asparaginase [Thermaurantimonas sp.]|uniref:asparaginase n=1 Tax=Thermaurantimonas sp. TaxID=2681568 RepID=UPI003919F0C7